MPKKSLQIKNFSGGLNTFSDPRDIKDSEFQALDNVSTDENARLRLSGGFESVEVVENFDVSEDASSKFGIPATQIGVIDTDYKPITIPNGDFSRGLVSELPTGWTIDNGNGSGWSLHSTMTNPYATIYNDNPCSNNEAIIAANQTEDLGSLTSPKFTLVPGDDYIVEFSIHANHPFFYHPLAELPRIIIKNDDLSKYYESSGFQDTDRWSSSFPNLIPHATSDLSIVPNDGDTPANIGWTSYADWNASATYYAEIDRVSVSTDETLNSYTGNTANYALRCSWGATYVMTNESLKGSIVTDPIDMQGVEAGVDNKFYFDCVYKTWAGEGTPYIVIFDAETDDILGVTTLNSSNDVFTNAKMPTLGFDYDMGATLNGQAGFTIGAGVTSIKLAIGKSGDGAGFFYITNMRLYSEGPVQLGYNENKWPQAFSFPLGHTEQYQKNVGFPNTWNQTTDSPYISASSWTPSKIEAMKRPRRYQMRISIPTDFEESDAWQVQFCAGKWGSTAALSDVGVFVSYVKLTRTSFNPKVGSTQIILVPKYIEDNGSNTTKITGYTYDKTKKIYDSFSEEMNDKLPSFTGKAYINFITIFGRTFISNGRFDNNDKVYQFFYDTISGQEGFRVTDDTFYIPNLSTLAVTSGDAIFDDATVDLLQVYKAHDPGENTAIMQFANNTGNLSLNSRRSGTLSRTSSGNEEDLGTYLPTTGDEYQTAAVGDQGSSGDNVAAEVTREAFKHVIPSTSTWSTGHGNVNSSDPFHMLFEFTGAELGELLENDISRITLEVSHQATLAMFTCLTMHNSNANGHNNWNSDGIGGNDDLPIGFEVSLLKLGGTVGSPNAISVLQTYHTQTISTEFSFDTENSYESSNEGVNMFGSVDLGQGGQDIEGSQFDTGNISGSLEFSKDFSYGEISIEDTLGIRIRPYQHNFPSGSQRQEFGVYYNKNGETYWGDAFIDEPVDHSSRGVQFEKWEVTSLTAKSYDIGFTGGTGVLNMSENSVGILMEFDTIIGAGEFASWATSGEWSVVLTTINFFDEESHINSVGNATFTNENDNHAPLMVFQVPSSNDFVDNMIKKIKIYMKKPTDSEYCLQATVDLIEGHIRKPGGIKYEPGNFTGDDGQQVQSYQLPRAELLSPNVENTYEHETFIAESLAERPEQLNARWRTSVMNGNRLYVGNVKQDGKVYSDRMLISGDSKFGIIPQENFLDISPNDGDEIISLHSYRDKILQFKKKRLFILNVAEFDSEYIEETIDGVGIYDESQIVDTIHGVAWVNRRGLFLYNGNSVNNLIDDKMAISKWKDTISGWDIKEEFIPIAGYDKISDKIIILPSGYSAQDISYNVNNPDIDIFDSNVSDNQNKESWRASVSYVYDFNRKSFVMNYAGIRGASNLGLPHYVEYNSNTTKLKLPPHDSTKSNFFHNEHGELMILSDTEYSSGFYVYNDIPSATPGKQDFFNDRNMRVITKDYDFGDPAIRKKVYKVYVTFKSTDEETILVENASLTKDFYASSFVKVYYALDGSNHWKEFDANKSKNYDATKGLVDKNSENTTTLTTALAVSDTSVVLGNTTNIKENYVIKIGEEHMLVKNVANSTTIEVERGYGYMNDDVNSYASLSGDAHEAESTVYISNGDWIQAELVPKDSINNIKSLKLMFVQAQITPALYTEIEEILGEELIDWNTYPFSDWVYLSAGSYTLDTQNSLSWVGVGESGNANSGGSTVYRTNWYTNILNSDDMIAPGEKVLITMTISNYVDSNDGTHVYSDRIGLYGSSYYDGVGYIDSGINTLFLENTAIDSDTDFGTGSKNGTYTLEWTRPADWLNPINSLYFRIGFGEAITCNFELSIKKIIEIESSVIEGDSPGNVPKGFQINDISVIHKHKNVK